MNRSTHRVFAFCKAMLRAIGLSCWLLGSLPMAAAQDAPANTEALLAKRDSAYEKLDEAYNSGDWKTALREARTVLRLNRQAFGELDDQLLTDQEQIVFLTVYEEGVPAARTAATEWRTLAERIHGPEHWRTIDAQRFAAALDKLAKVPAANLASLLADDKAVTLAYAREQYEDAVRLSPPLIERWKQAIGPDDPLIANGLELLAYSHSASGKTDEATAALAQVALIRQKSLGSRHPSYADTLVDLAELRRDAGKTAEALKLFEEARTVRRAALGEEHEDYATLLYDLGSLYRTAGRYAQAVPILEEAARLQAKLYGEETQIHGNTLSLLGMVHKARGDFAAAEPLYRKSLTIQEAAVGKDHPDYAAVLNNLGVMFLEARKYREAEPLLAAAVANAKTHAEEYPDTYALYAQNLASLAMMTGDLNRAEQQYLELLADAEKRVGRKDLRTASILYDLGYLYAEQRNATKAEPYYREALEIRRPLLGSEHPDVITGVHSLGVLYQEHGQPAKAEPLLVEALELRRKVLGNDHPLTAQSLRNLGVFYNSTEQFLKARPYFAAAVAIHERLQALDPSLAQSSAESLADLQVEAGNYAEAEELYRRLVKVQEERHGAKSLPAVKAWLSLASVLRGRGDLAQAESLLDRALATSEELAGREGETTCDSLRALAQLHNQRGEFARALPLFERAVEISRKVRGPEHSATIDARRELAQLHFAIGDRQQAESIYRQALAGLEKQVGPEHPRLVTDLNNLGLVLTNSERPLEGEQLFSRARTIIERAYGPDSPKLAVVLDNLALAQQATGRLNEAEALLVRSLAIRQRAVGDQHPDYAHSLNNLAYVRQRRGELAAARELYAQSLAIFERAYGPRHPSATVASNNLAGVCLLEGRDVEAAEILARSAAASRQSLDETFAVMSERQQLAMLKNVRGSLDGLLSLAGKSQKQAEAYETVLSWKGAVFSRQRWSHVAARNQQAAPTLARLQSVSNKLATLALTARRPASASPIAELEALTDEKERLERTLQAALSAADLAELRGGLALTIADLQKQLPADAALVDFFEYEHYSRPAAGEGGDIDREPHLLAFVVLPNQPVKLVNLGPAEPIAALVDDWRKLFGAVAGSAAMESAGAKLRRQVWEPIAEHLAGRKLVLISPDGALGRIPLAALPGREPGTYLLEEVALAVIPVPQQLPALLARATRPMPATAGNEAPAIASLLLVGDVDYGAPPGAALGSLGAAEALATRGGIGLQFGRLENAFAEISTIERRFRRQFRGSDVETLDQELATEAAFREQAGKHRFLHLATHGFFAPPQVRSALAEAGSTGDRAPSGESPGLAAYHPGLLSGLALAGANQPPQAGQDDGILTALEVASLDLAEVDLAVLSACETGLGRVAGGEGVLGLQRAFQVAGARTTVASLWTVPDLATSLLMQRFYDNLWEKRMSKVEALREAQLSLLRDGTIRGLEEVETPVAGGEKKRLAPFFWAAFVLAGDWR